MGDTGDGRRETGRGGDGKCGYGETGGGLGDQTAGGTVPARDYKSIQNIRKTVHAAGRIEKGRYACVCGAAGGGGANSGAVAAGQIFVGDHHMFNCWVWNRGRWVRPWITAWGDFRSRAIVGFYITEAPNQTTIMRAFKRAIEIYGPPDSVKIDNGKDYDSEMWTGITKAKRRALKKGYLDEMLVAGIYAMMDIGVSFAIPYHPQSKPVERFFDTMDRQMDDFLAICESLGWACPGKAANHFRQKNVNNELIISTPQMEAILHLKDDLGWNELQLAGMIRRMTGQLHDSVQYIAPQHAHNIIEAMKNMLARKTGKEYGNLQDVQDDMEVEADGEKEQTGKSG